MQAHLQNHQVKFMYQGHRFRWRLQDTIILACYPQGWLLKRSS